VFVVNIAVVQAADGYDFTHLKVTIIADKLGHRPRFKGRAMRTQSRKMAHERPD
jgi:hypothetical protein